jgi:hypothetical protein
VTNIDPEEILHSLEQGNVVITDHGIFLVAQIRGNMGALLTLNDRNDLDVCTLPLESLQKNARVVYSSLDDYVRYLQVHIATLQVIPPLVTELLAALGN